MSIFEHVFDKVISKYNLTDIPGVLKLNDVLDLAKSAWNIADFVHRIKYIQALPDDRFSVEEKSALESEMHEVIKQLKIELTSKGFHFSDQNDGTYYWTWNFKAQEDESHSMEDCIIDAKNFYDHYQPNNQAKM